MTSLSLFFFPQYFPVSSVIRHLSTRLTSRITCWFTLTSASLPAMNAGRRLSAAVNSNHINSLTPMRSRTSVTSVTALTGRCLVLSVMYVIHDRCIEKNDFSTPSQSTWWPLPGHVEDEGKQWLLAYHYSHPLSALRLSNFDLGLYLDGWPLWYVNFCW